MTIWSIDPSEPLANPSAMLAYYERLLGSGSGSLVLPEILVATFQQLALSHLVTRVQGPEPVRWPAPGLWPVSVGSHNDRAIAVARLPMGAPAAAMALELMIAAGVKTIVLAGSAGSLQPGLPVGSLAIATEAIRHEGTSHHYLPAEEPARASDALVQRLAQAAQSSGLDPAIGKTWTTDGIFRECADTIARHRSSGVLAVEMEASALFAVAQHRRVQIALIVAISDVLVPPWTPSFHAVGFRKALISAADLALDAASPRRTNGE